MKHVWDLGDDDDSLLPVLGICLGFQSLVVHCGGVVRKLSTGLHGMIRPIDHADNDVLPLSEGNIFAGVPEFKATLYHSLFADIGQQQGRLEAGSEQEWARGNAKWNSPAHLPDVVPLAWVTERRDEGFDERILMGVKHRRKPFWGLQYHPESVCTESTGHQVIKNWFAQAARWNRARGRIAKSEVDGSLEGLTYNLPKKSEKASRPFLPTLQPRSPPGSLAAPLSHPNPQPSLWDQDLGCEYFSTSLELPNHVEVPDIVESLQAGRRDFVVLDSASAKTSRTGLDVKGRYSIIALDVDKALQLEYRTGSRQVTLRRRRTDSGTSAAGDRESGEVNDQYDVELIGFDEEHTIWSVLASFWSRREHPIPANDDTTHPFLGGFMGFTTYELGLEGIQVKPLNHDRHSRPDLSFAWVTRSAVVDHMEGTICLQTLSSDEHSAAAWLEQAAQTLQASPVWTDGLGADFSKKTAGGDLDRRLLHAANTVQAQPTPPLTPDEKRSARTHIQIPDADEYEAKVRQCQEYIAAGDSYELCLTDQTLITRPKSPGIVGLVPGTQQHHGPYHNGSKRPQQAIDSTACASLSSSSSSPSSWSLYRTLRTRNPAPFGSYIRLSGATLVSSSPERFLQVSGSTGTCSMRPMKGTVKKSSTVCTLAQAEEILHVPKEEAENLMIVDLVRHDLHSVCGVGKEAVAVPQLLKVEEYASVFQMISVVEGQLPPSPPLPVAGYHHRRHHPQGDSQQQLPPRPNGLDVLAATLPPGSMTGAPKKRSCEILQHLEGPSAERSLYSGVVGYMDVRGHSDWSVTIRSLFRWDDEEDVVVVLGEHENDEQHQQHQHSALEVWHIGAGGAVTALSTPHGERDEMFTKLKGPLGVFEHQV
ncbi:ADC synthase [Microdochium trichocladiopsis]|uniref:aminodeoxychorismate synthase n=1 Tax=Microdochium trichocladiopsis TaxID=1682393 RepID=A0A9P8Y719_9PEZI|nr:ADC synthase [Microdochium trichocladiopsis]KAH7033345.1 ADC synthase [Microdochium trichocladiopsis]